MENVDAQRGGSGAGALEGTVLAGRYRLAQVVSSGANTVIMDAVDLESDGQVTLKVVRPEHARDPVFRRKFRRLAEVSAALTHPNIASVTDWGEIELRGESTVFWTVDALGGGSLRDLLDRGRLLEPGQALVIGLETCRALDAAHHKGLFHTELTPSKMVFGVDRRLRVVDFGMARLLAEPAWADAATVPTHVARYASPEQALGLPVDAKTDVYALALVMIEAVTGAVPFAADSTVATLAGRVDKLLPVSADLGSLASVLERAGRPESADRFTAAEFGRSLVQAASKLSKPEPIPILVSGTFDTTAMRRPTDPTGGVERPAPVAGLAGVDETGVAGATGAASASGAAAAAAAAGAAAVAGAAVAATTADDQHGVEPRGDGSIGEDGVDPITEDPVAEEVAGDESSGDEPSTDEPSVDEPSVDESNVDESSVGGSSDGAALGGASAPDEASGDGDSSGVGGAAAAVVAGAAAAGAAAVTAGANEGPAPSAGVAAGDDRERGDAPAEAAEVDDNSPSDPDADDQPTSHTAAASDDVSSASIAEPAPIDSDAAGPDVEAAGPEVDVADPIDVSDSDVGVDPEVDVADPIDVSDSDVGVDPEVDVGPEVDVDSEVDVADPIDVSDPDVGVDPEVDVGPEVDVADSIDVSDSDTDPADEVDVESDSETDPASTSIAGLSEHATTTLGADASATPANALDPDAPVAQTAVLPVSGAGPAGGGVFDDEPTRRRRGPIIVTVVLLVAGLVALGYAGSLLLQTKSFAVPVLAGVPEDEALNQIAGNGWELETLRERSDSFPEPDTVIRTVPGAGVELDEGEPFTLVLSDGPEFRTLPELAELPFDAAVAELAGLGLIGIEGPERQFSETVPPDSVIVWQVQGDADGGLQAGGQILPGETIVMTLSKGPEPRIVPSLDGLTGPEARVVIEDLQLVFERNDDVFSDTVAAGLIVSQTPAADASLDRGATVTVEVSKGPDVVEFPDLEGLVFSEAQDLLVSTGLTIGSLLGTTEGTFVEATIDGADVPVGEILRRGTAIDLIFL